MPELPEVETTRRGIVEVLQGQALKGAVLRERRLRWSIPEDLDDKLRDQVVRRIWRRAKYLILDFDHGHLILHLGMSGSLRFVDSGLVPEKHDHFDLLLHDGRALRYRDPRRFGACLWWPGPIAQHPLLAKLGPEPLEGEFDGNYLHTALRGRSVAIKLALMDNAVVVGVGNIYANEALFRAGINPRRVASLLSRPACQRLTQVVQEVLNEAISKGGSTLKDFHASDGQPGYFQQSYFVYGRTGQPCLRCGSEIRRALQGQRASFWCPLCQKR